MRNFSSFLIIFMLLFCSCSISTNNVATSSLTSYEEIIQTINYKNLSICLTNSSIYKQKVNTNDKIFLVSNSQEIINMLLYEQNIYYLVINNECFEIFSVNVETASRKSVFKSNLYKSMQGEIFHSWDLYKNKIYIQTGFKFFEYDLKKQKLTLIHNDVGIYDFHEDCLYYIEHASRTFTIYEMNLNTKKVNIVLGKGIYEPDKTESGLLISNFLITDNGDIIYIQRKPVYGLYKLTNGESTLIDNDESINEYFLSYSDGYVYYEYLEENKITKKSYPIK